MENTSCLTAHDHTAYILGQGVETLKTTMYAYPPLLKDHLLVPYLPLYCKTAPKPNKNKQK